MGIDQINNVATKGGSLQKQKKSRKETVNSNEGRSDVTYTGTLKRQKRLIIGDNREEYCKNLEIDAMFSQAIADTFAVTTSAVSSVSLFGSGAAAGALGASVANYAAKSSLDAAYIQHDCDDIPFDEIKEVLDVRFSEIDRNLDVSYSTLKLISQMVGENTSIIEETRAAVYKGFDNVLNSIKNSRTGPTISKLDNFIQYFMSEKKVIMNLPHDQYIAKVQEQNGVLFNLRDSRTTKADSLNTLLYDIINQKYAIPENLNDKAAFYALYSLYYGTQSYVSVMYFLLEQYSYLADYHYQNGDMKEYNKYFDLTQIIFRDFQHSLIGVTSNGISLIDNVVNVFNEVKNKKFIKSKEDLFDLLSQRIESLTDVKLRLQGMKLPMIADVPEKLIGRPTFTESIVTTPIGKWEDGAKVSYAVQYKYNDTLSKVGEWSDQLTINGKANPLLKVPVDSKRRTRLIFRKFNDDKPQLVGVIENRYQTEFKDLDRDLYNAASRFDENVAMREIGILIRNGANINAAFDKERRAIHAAAQSGNIQLVQNVLLRNNATDINVKDSDGYTPMHIAAQVGNEGFIDLLIGRGADVNAKTSLRKLTPLHIAAYKGYVSAVEILMKSDGIDVNAREKEDFSPLHSAVIGGVPVVQALLSNSDVDVNARSHDGLTPLHLSSIHNYLDVAEALLESNEVDINAMANGNLTALHLASLIGNLEMVKFLAARNGIDVNKKSIEGWVPLHFAVAFKNGNVVAELLNINSINVNAVGKDNIIPLHLAAITGQKSIVLSLLEKGAKIDEKTKDGLTALHLATANDKREVIFTLIDRGAKTDEKTVDGFTPLHFATQNGYLELVKYFVDEKGVDFHITDNSGRTPLQVTDQLDIVKYFIEEKKASYEHCIFDVVERGRLNILSYLIAKGADINKQGSFGNTLLHIAILGGNLDIVKCLIEKKADVNIKNNEDWTPLYVAAKYGRLDIVKYLAAVVLKVNRKIDVAVNKYLKFVWAYLFTAMLLLYRSSFRAIPLSKQSTVSY